MVNDCGDPIGRQHPDDPGVHHNAFQVVRTHDSAQFVAGNGE